MDKIELEATPIPADEAVEIMVDDALTLLGNDIFCPLARAIEEAIASLSVPLAPPQPRD